MPKYYVNCLGQKAVVSGSDPLDACIAAAHKLGVSTVGCVWWVSERGFEKHEDDLLIPDQEIIREWRRRYGGFNWGK